MSEHKQFVVSTLEQARGDDLYRAEAAFKGYTDEQLDTKYGQSDQTCREILEGYRACNAKIDAAIEWAKAAN